MRLTLAANSGRLNREGNRFGPVDPESQVHQLLRPTPHPPADRRHPGGRPHVPQTQPQRTGPNHLRAPAVADPLRQQPHPAGDASAGGTRTALDPDPGPSSAPDGAGKSRSCRARGPLPGPPSRCPWPRSPRCGWRSRAALRRSRSGTNSCTLPPARLPPADRQHLRYFLRDRDGRSLGCLLFDFAAVQLGCRDQWIGWQGRSSRGAGSNGSRS